MSSTNIFKRINGNIAQLVSRSAISATLVIVARVLASAIFITAGYSKLGAGYAGTQAYMASAGVPGALLPLVIARWKLAAGYRCCSASRPVWWHSCWRDSVSFPA